MKGHIIELSEKNINKGFVLSTELDYSFAGKMKKGFPNNIYLSDVKKEKDAIERAKKIVREKYEYTEIKHIFTLSRDGKVVARIVSPDWNDPDNLPLCHLCYEKGKKEIARFTENFDGTIIYSCEKDRISNKYIKFLATRISPVSLFDLWEKKVIFPNQ